jgi:hypothetical protein
MQRRKDVYKNSGVEQAAKKAEPMFIFGFFQIFIRKFSGRFGNGRLSDLRRCGKLRLFYKYADSKNARTCRLTLSMKNLMGVCGGNRSTMHWNIDKKLAEVLAFIKRI